MTAQNPEAILIKQEQPTIEGLAREYAAKQGLKHYYQVRAKQLGLSLRTYCERFNVKGGYLMLSETELIMHLSKYSDWCVEDADDGDVGYYAYADGGYLPNCYQSPREALLAIQDYFEGGA